MAIDFGNTIMEGGIAPSVQVQSPVEDNSGAILAKGLAPVAGAVGGIVGSIFKANQEDATAKVLTQYENEHLDLADMVDQGMDPNEARIRARALRREYLANFPSLQSEFDKIWSNFAGPNGLGHVVIEGTIDQQIQQARYEEAGKMGYTPEQYDAYQAMVNQAKALEIQLGIIKSQGGIVTESMRNQSIQVMTGLADKAFPAAQAQINQAMAQIEANPAQKAEITAAVVNNIKTDVAQLEHMTGGLGAEYITTPINNLLSTFQEWSAGSVETSTLEAHIKNTQAKYEAMYASDPILGPTIAHYKLLEEIGLSQSPLAMSIYDTDLLRRLKEVGDQNYTLNILGQQPGDQKLVNALNESLSIELTDEAQREVANIYAQIIDGAYIHERSVNDPLGYQDTIEALGSPEATEFFKTHDIPAQHSDKFVDIIGANYQEALLPAISQYWTTTALPIAGPGEVGYGSTDAESRSFPISELLDPVWNGSVVEFVPKEAFANDPRVRQIAQDTNTGNSSIGVPLNNLIRAISNVSGQDAKAVWESQFAGRLFGLGDEGVADRTNRMLDQTSTVSSNPEADIDLTMFQPGTAEFESLVGEGEIDVTTLDPSQFVEPASNPNVNQSIVQKYAGRTLPVSIRNNNMGAISITGDIASSWAARQPGFVGTSPRPANEGGYYAKYATPEHGVGAASKLLEIYGKQGVNTPAAIVRKWSTSTSAHNAYANTLVKYLKQAGFDVQASTSLDLSDPNVRLAILKAKSAHEAGAGQPVYNDAVFKRGVNYQF
jgi:hypothetical protein